MSRPRNKAKARAGARPASAVLPVKERLAGWRWAAVLALVLLIFYWIPLFSANASIQWDAVDTNYSPQKYFADRIRQGEIPFWTPYIFSGFPFLADPQVGAWYPLNWAFFLAGIMPRAIQAELVLHAFLACAGAYLLFFRVIANRPAALLGALAYGLSGFFAGHSSHLGIFSTAAGLPWLLLCFRRALEAQPVRWAALGGAAGGLIILAGHFQTALYCFAALALYAASAIITAPRCWLRVAGVLGCTILLALGLSMIQTLPGLELTQNSIRGQVDTSHSTEGVLLGKPLLTLLFPDALSALSGDYSGPDDVTQHYFYAGLLLLPLAALGLRNPAARIPAALLLIPAVWYMLGPAAGLYRMGALLPGFHKVRAPIHGWFVVALALALLAAAGARWIFERWPHRSVALLVCGVFFLDLAWFNSWRNPLAYARSSFEALYGAAEQAAQRKLVPALPTMTRFHAPEGLAVFGPMNHPLDVRLEATYGYNPLQLSTYSQYREAARSNPRLLDGLNAGLILDPQIRAVRQNLTVLPRAYFARAVVEARDSTQSARLLASLNPAERTILTGPHPAIRQDPNARASIVSEGEQAYRVRYTAVSPSLLRLSIPFFPGWRATLDGASCAIVPADHALLGVVVPPGEKELVLHFHSNHFALGAALSALAALLIAGLALKAN